MATKHRNRIYRIALLACVLLVALLANAKVELDGKLGPTTRYERKMLRQGNELNKQKRYAEAEVAYRKAIAFNSKSELGRYNLAVALLNQTKASEGANSDSIVAQADRLFGEVTQMSHDPKLLSRAYYNRGNIAYKAEDYQRAIDMYKDCLRRDSHNEQARENLRLAQLKLKEQQDKNNGGGGGGNDDQKDKQDKDKDKNDQNRDQDKQNQNQEQSNQDKEQNREQQQPQQGASSEQILNAVEEKEKGAQQRVNMQQARQQERNRTRKKW